MGSTAMEAASSLGLRFNGGDQMLGEVGGVVVRLWLSDRGARRIAAEIAVQHFDETLSNADVLRGGGPWR
ncbi:MAG: hypothetical protein KTR31_31880 [Myxococcales bacterium]|nr:hypothetical protein [Myxococcales bacterium]